MKTAMMGAFHLIKECSIRYFIVRGLQLFYKLTIFVHLPKGVYLADKG